MKRILNVFLIVLLLFVTGCVNKDIKVDSNKSRGMNSVDNIKSNSQTELEEKYSLAEDNSKSIEINMINDYNKLNDLNYALNLSVSIRNTTIDAVNDICNIKQIRRVNRTENVYYCVFKYVEDNIKPLYIYIFFENEQLIGCVQIRNMLTFNDFKDLKINKSTLEDIEKIDEAVFENTMSFYFDNNVYADDKISSGLKTKVFSFSTTDKGYVKITYKNTIKKNQYQSEIPNADQLVIKKIENVENDLIKGINKIDLVQ